MSQQPLIQITLGLEGLDPADLLDLTANLRQEISETDVDSVETVSGPAAPAASKGLDPETAQLLVTLASGLVPSIILLAQNFLLRQKDQTLKIKIKDVEIEVPRQASPEEIERMAKLVEKIAKRVK